VDAFGAEGEKVKHLKYLSELVSMGVASLEKPTEKTDIENFESFHHMKLPPEILAFYGTTNSLHVFNNCLRIEPLISENGFSVSNASDLHRSWQWPVPLEMYIFGDDGSGSPFGFWISGNTPGITPIVQMGEIFEPECMTICALSFSSFLISQFSFRLLEEDRENIDIVKKFVPNMKSGVQSDGLLKEVSIAIDPSLEKLHLDPYEDKLSREDIEEFISDFQSRNP
jgi:hypothetical protein